MTEADGWSSRLGAVSLSKATMNRLVMDYLVVEGHKEAAERFQAESGTHAGLDLETIAERKAVRAAVERGDISAAVERAGQHVIESNLPLRFAVLQQRLIELIRTSAVDEAIEFAQAELAPVAEGNVALLAELERTMLLLAYEDPSKSPEAALLGQARRKQTASLLNAAVLANQDQEQEAALPMMLRRLRWAQVMARALQPSARSR